MKKSTSQKALYELTRAELDTETERLFGLPCPPPNAPISAWHEYIVAAFFLHFAANTDAISTANEQAATFLLEKFTRCRNQIRPHIERALGRRLSELEMADRTLYV